jgi:hypothetical protein
MSNNMNNQVQIKSDNILRSLVKVGKEININIKVLDHEKCLKFLDTLNEKNQQELGVSVIGWGFFIESFSTDSLAEEDKSNGL